MKNCGLFQNLIAGQSFGKRALWQAVTLLSYWLWQSQAGGALSGIGSCPLF